MASQFRVIFKGEVLPGFDPVEVRSKAASKLKADTEQLARIFSGRASVLKKGVSEELGRRYVTELARIGMLVKLQEIPAETAQPPAQSVPLAVPVMHTTVPPQEPSSDLEKTQLADSQALSRYLQETPDAASAPTLIVSAGQQAALMQNIQTGNAASAATLIVTPAAKAPTLIVQSAQVEALAKHDPERTLIANQDALDAYFKSNSGAQPAALMTGGIAEPHTETHDPHKTQLNPAALDAYLAGSNARSASMSTSPQVEIRAVPVTIAEPEAVAVMAPVVQPSPFSGMSTPSQWLEQEPEAFEATPLENKSLKPLWIGTGIVMLLVLLWWFL
jgi:hypothetical protein